MTTTQIDTKDLTALIAHARRGADDLARQIIDGIVERTQPAAPDTFSVRLTRDRDGWTAETLETLTDEQAKRFTFRTEPADVRLGEFFQMVDAGGTRIGHLASATYHERMTGPAYVVCTIELR